MVKVGGKVAALTQSLPARGYLGPWDEYTVKAPRGTQGPAGQVLKHPAPVLLDLHMVSDDFYMMLTCHKNLVSWRDCTFGTPELP